MNHVSAEALTTEGWYPQGLGLIVQKQSYQPSDSNKNVDICYCVHDTFLE
jgi:hypothetical protein